MLRSPGERNEGGWRKREEEEEEEEEEGGGGEGWFDASGALAGNKFRKRHAALWPRRDKRSGCFRGRRAVHCLP